MTSKYKSVKDGYLQRKFGITEEEVKEAKRTHGDVCMACRRPPGTRDLHIDHDHSVENWKIKSTKIDTQIWEARPDGVIGGRLDFCFRAKTMPAARKLVKAKLKRLSVRGILCWHCNAGLKKYQDDADRIHRIATYLDDYYDFLNGVSDGRNGFGE